MSLSNFFVEIGSSSMILPLSVLFCCSAVIGQLEEVDWLIEGVVVVVVEVSFSFNCLVRGLLVVVVVAVGVARAGAFRFALDLTAVVVVGGLLVVVVVVAHLLVVALCLLLRTFEVDAVFPADLNKIPEFSDSAGATSRFSGRNCAPPAAPCLLLTSSTSFES